MLQQQQKINMTEIYFVSCDPHILKDDISSSHFIAEGTTLRWAPNAQVSHRYSGSAYTTLQGHQGSGREQRVVCCLLCLGQGPGGCRGTFPGENTAAGADDRTACGVPGDSGGQARSQVRGRHPGTRQTEKQGWRQQCQLQGRRTGVKWRTGRVGEDARQTARQGGSGLWGGGHRTAAGLQHKAACGPASLRALGSSLQTG